MNVEHLKTLLRLLYEEPVADALAVRIEERVHIYRSAPTRQAESEKWDPDHVVLIAYADCMAGADSLSPLATLQHFLLKWVGDAISHVHLLPFYPYTSDDGFAVSEYRSVKESHGNWFDIEELSRHYSLVFDFVVNHASSAHPRFQQFLSDQAPGNRCFKTASPDDDLSLVTRPRATPLLQEFQSVDGPRWVWCTFSRDQVDWDFENPDVLFEFVDLLVTYYERGASWLRVDAVAYLWKEIGTRCVHLPQTHAVVKIFRLVAEALSPAYKLLTETNVPLAENLSYFGAGDEAHIVYNFPLPPLLLHALIFGKAKHLTRWCQSLPPLPDKCVYLNFSASHDGIGLRPVEGILTLREVDDLVLHVQSLGGRVNERRQPDGSLAPYEINISLFEALKGTLCGNDAWQVERFLLSQCLVSSLAGVPALYYNSLLATPNDVEGVRLTGVNRSINRKKWSYNEVEEHLRDSEEAPRRVLDGIKRMLEIRRCQRAFHPEAGQECFDISPDVFTVSRSFDSQRILCFFNLTRESVSLRPIISALGDQSDWQMLYQQGEVKIDDGFLGMSPYAVAWIQVG